MKTGMRTGWSLGPVLLRHKKMQDRGPVLQVLGPTGPGPSRTGRTDDHPYLLDLLLINSLPFEFAIPEYTL